MEPLVTVIITTFNRELTLKRAITSVIHQSYNNLEIIISDNASLDGTLVIANNFLNIDKRIHIYCHSANVGMRKNFEFAIQKSTGKYITFLSSDDEFNNTDFILSAVSQLELYPSVGLCHSINLLKNDFSNTLSLDFSYTQAKFLYTSTPVNGRYVFLGFALFNLASFGGTLFRTEIFLSYSHFKPGIYSFDVESILRLLLVSDIIFLPCQSYIFHNNSSSFTSGLRSPRVYISNLRYIDSSYQDASESRLFSELILYVWRSLVTADYISNVLMNYILSRSKGAAIIHSFLLRNRPFVLPFLYLRLLHRLSWNMLVSIKAFLSGFVYG